MENTKFSDDIYKKAQQRYLVKMYVKTFNFLGT